MYSYVKTGFIPTRKPRFTLSAKHLALLHFVIYYLLLIISVLAIVERNREMLLSRRKEEDAEKNTDDLHKAPQGATALFSSTLRDYYRTITDSCTSMSKSTTAWPINLQGRVIYSSVPLASSTAQVINLHLGSGTHTRGKLKKQKNADPDRDAH